MCITFILIVLTKCNEFKLVLFLCSVVFMVFIGSLNNTFDSAVNENYDQNHNEYTVIRKRCSSFK
jgi:hypothetical protein